MAITKRGKNWQARLWWKDNLGKKHSKTKDGFKTKSEAANWLSEARVKHNSGIDIVKNPIFTEYFWNWYHLYREKTLRSSTKLRYRTAYHHLQNYWGNKKIKDITRNDWQKFINHLGEKLSAGTVNDNCTYYKSCVKSAVADGIIAIDFTYNTKIVGNEKNTRKDKVVFLSVSEIKKLFNTAVDNRSIKSTSPYIIITGILTGARISEIKALKWENIDFKNKTITIDHSYNEKDHKLVPTKNISSNRTIKVTQQLLDILNELKANNTELIFENPRYRTVPLTGTVNLMLKKLMAKAGLSRPAFTFHSLRHCHVAMLLYQNVDIYAISQRLGHKNVNITLGIYAYMIDEMKKENELKVEEKLNDLFSPTETRNTNGTQREKIKTAQSQKR